MEEIVCDDLLGKIIQFTRSKRFTSRIDDFIYENLKEFHNISECKEYNSEEFPLHYTTKFQSYRQMIDEMFDQFAKENGLSTREVFSCFRDSGNYISWEIISTQFISFFTQRIISLQYCLKNMSISGL